MALRSSRRKTNPVGISPRKTFQASETMKTPHRSILVDRSNRVPNAANKVKFQVEESDNSRLNVSRGYTPSKRPLLGYDWIAGMVDLRTSTITSARDTDLSQDYLDEIDQFRKANRDECRSKVADDSRECRFSPVVKPHRRHFSSPDPSDVDDSRILDFTVNSRLFPVAVAGDTRSIRPGTTADPRFIRISVPKSVLSTPNKYKKPLSVNHDSMALNDHCMLGRQHSVSRSKKSKPKHVPHLDLRASLRQMPAKSENNSFLASHSTMVSLPPSLLGSHCEHL